MGDAEMSRDILNLQKSETSDFIDTNIRTFGGKTSVLLPKEVRCFQFPVLPFWKPLRHSPQKKFCKKNYISYTMQRNVQYIKAISGVGFGVGCSFWV